MTQVLTPFDSLLTTIVLVTLAIGMPILVILAIRVLWNRNLYLGRSKELEKLIWQLHRIASAMEHQMNLSFPTLQPGTEDASDLAYLQQRAAPVQAAAPSVATTPPLHPAQEPAAQHPATPERTALPSAFPPLAPSESSAEPQRHGVNSMFGL